MTAPEARKQILIAESGIHRALLGRDFEEVAAAARTLVDEGKRAAKLAASVALVFGASRALRRGGGDRAPSRHSLLRTVFHLAVRTLPLWAEVFRAASQKDHSGDKKAARTEAAPVGK